MTTYDSAWMSALWGRIGTSVWAFLALVGITVTGSESSDIMAQGSSLIQSGWAFAAQAGTLIATILPLISKLRESKRK